MRQILRTRLRRPFAAVSSARRTPNAMPVPPLPHVLAVAQGGEPPAPQQWLGRQPRREPEPAPHRATLPAITPTAFSKAQVDEASLLVVDESGTVLEGRHKAFSEWELHRAVYQERADVEVVLHDPPIATAFGIAKQALEPVAAGGGGLVGPANSNAAARLAQDSRVDGASTKRRAALRCLPDGGERRPHHGRRPQPSAAPTGAGGALCQDPLGGEATWPPDAPHRGGVGGAARGSHQGRTRPRSTDLKTTPLNERRTDGIRASSGRDHPCSKGPGDLGESTAARPRGLTPLQRASFTLFRAAPFICCVATKVLGFCGASRAHPMA